MLIGDKRKIKVIICSFFFFFFFSNNKRVNFLVILNFGRAQLFTCFNLKLI